MPEFYALDGERSWVYRDCYGTLTITRWRPCKTKWVFIVERWG